MRKVSVKLAGIEAEDRAGRNWEALVGKSFRKVGETEQIHLGNPRA
jgi:hypothetical protein